jgi:hypothetical protein
LRRLGLLGRLPLRALLRLTLLLLLLSKRQVGRG